MNNFLKNCKVKLDSLFYKFISFERKGRLTVLQELGLTCISLDGEKSQEYFTSESNDCKVENDSIELSTDEFTITILNSTGEVISRV